MAREIVCLATDFNIKYYTKLRNIKGLDPPMKTKPECLLKAIFKMTEKKDRTLMVVPSPLITGLIPGISLLPSALWFVGFFSLYTLAARRAEIHH
jgi:hypothetical protein